MTNRGPTNPLGVSGSVATAGLPRPEAGAVLEGAIKPSAELAAARRDVVPTPLNEQIEKTQVRPASTASHAALARGAAQGMAHRSQSGSVAHLRTRARRVPQVNTKSNSSEGVEAEGAKRSLAAPTAMVSRAQQASRDQGVAAQQSTKLQAQLPRLDVTERVVPPSLVARLSSLREMIQALEQQIAQPGVPEAMLQAARAELPRLRALVEATLRDMEIVPPSPDPNVKSGVDQTKESPLAKRSGPVSRMVKGLLRLLGLGKEEPATLPTAPKVVRPPEATQKTVFVAPQRAIRVRVADIRGRVLDKITGAPIEGVTIFGGELGNATTDSDGRFAFPNVALETGYTLVAIKFEYEFEPAEISDVVTMAMEHTFVGERGL